MLVAMSTMIDTVAFDRGTDPLLQLFTSEQIQQLARFEPPEDLQSRIEVLAEKANEGELLAAEQAEYEGYVRANHFIAVLQAKARRYLAAHTGF